LLLDTNGIAALKSRIATAAWARASWVELSNSVVRALNRPIELPPRGGNWSHNYVCPTHGARLSQGKQLAKWEWEHICPVGHHVLHGDPSKATLDFDGNAIAGIHGKYAQEAVNAGLVYQVTGQQRFAQKARDILLAYAARYLTYPLHDNQGKPGRGGRVASQPLTEASWLIDIAQGADLVWNTLSGEERKSLEDKLLRPALDEIILPRPQGIHNIQCRRNSAIGLVGFLLGDEKLISIAIDDPANGFRKQLEKGVLDDGMWLEGASGYHFFTIAGLWSLAEAARNCGINLYAPKFQAMFDGPLALAMPNFVLPNFNDSGMVPLQNQSDLYELAYARFHQPAYAGLLAESDRRGQLALLYGETAPLSKAASTSALKSASHNSPASGYAILQRGEGKDGTWLCVKYGPHGGGHGHPDKNTFVLYARGEVVATDAGTHAYGSPLHRDWDKTTLAHNTVVVDETSQEPATGKCLAFGTERNVDYCITDGGAIYKGVRFIRTAAMLTTNLILFIDQIRCEGPHTLDLAYHQMGEWKTNGWKASPITCSAAAGYSRLQQTFRHDSKLATSTFKTRLNEKLQPSITLANNEPTEIVTGYGLLKTTEDLVPMLLQRRHAQNTAFVWAVALDGTAVELQVSGAQDGSGNSVELSEVAQVELKAKGQSWTILANPSQRAVKLPEKPGEMKQAFLVLQSASE